MKLKYFIIITLLLTGCQKPESKNPEVIDVINLIAKNVTIENGETKDLKQDKNAEEFGVATEDISEGIVYYSTVSDKVDKVILVKAASEDSIENIETALSAELIEITSFWENNDTENKKIEKHLLKTKDDYVILAIADEVEQIEMIFDRLV